MRTWSGGARVRLGNYQPLLELAAGGMATVYLARQLGAAGFERLVVIKRVHRALLKDREAYDMLIDEARVASLIRHPNVVPVIDVVEADGEIFLVLEYVESIPMSALLAAARAAGGEGRLPSAVASRILVDVLAGLHAAHEASDMKGHKLEVVHRDVSPQNVIVGVDGVARLIDFGIAKATRRVTVTSAGVMKGKFGYMAPEQAKQLPLDRRADVFSAGIVAFEALTGRRLFAGEDQGDILLATLLADVPEPTSLAPDLPAKLDFVVQTALARDREERFQTAAAFQVALETALPPAPAREVAELVARHGGDALARRRDALRVALEQPPEEPVAGEPREPDEPRAGDARGSAAADPRASAAADPRAGATDPRAVAATDARRNSGESSASQVDRPAITLATEGASAPRRSARVRMGLLFGASIAIGAAATIAVVREAAAPDVDAPAASAATPPSAAPPAAATTPSAAAPASAGPIIEVGPPASAVPASSDDAAGSAAAPTKRPGPRTPRPVSSDLQANPYRTP